jgi:hypothetical protein
MMLSDYISLLNTFRYSNTDKNGFRVALSETKSVSRKQLSSSSEQKKLCRNYVKELTLNPSLGKRGTFLPLLFAREGGKGDELFNFFITTQPQNEEGIEKTTFDLLNPH